MKNIKKGFLVPPLVIIVALLAIGLGSYIFINQQAKAPITNQVVNTVATTSDSSINTQATSTQITNSSTTNPIELTPQIILNSSYNFGGKEIYNFKDGVYYFGYVVGKGDSNQITNYPDQSFTAVIDKSMIFFGDFSGDGIKDAVIIKGEQLGGTGFFMSLVALKNVNGKPIVSGAADLGDRQVIKSLKIDNGIISLDYLTQGNGDGACCASQPVHTTYKVVGDKLVKISEIKTISPSTQNQNTSDWKTYDSGRGFLFKYPSDWNVISTTPNGVGNNVDVLVSPDTSSSNKSIHISQRTSCQTLIQSHPGKIPNCKESKGFAVWYAIHSNTQDLQTDSILDGIVSSITIFN